jgi:gamma-glutamylputrescine oxidase
VVVYRPRVASTHLASRSVSSVQTFLGLTEPLSDAEAHRMFPDGRCMVWDTDLIYQYFRLTADRRLLIGASSLLFTYVPRRRRHHDLVLDRMYSYLRQKFRGSTVRIEFLWPGSIGVSKDFLPVVGLDPRSGIRSAERRPACRGPRLSATTGRPGADRSHGRRSGVQSRTAFPRRRLLGTPRAQTGAFAISQAVVKLT